MLKAFFISLIFLGGVAFAAPQEAEDSATKASETSESVEERLTVTASQEAAQKENDEDKWVCRREKITGSNRSQRICRLQSDIVRERKEARESLQRAHRGEAKSGDWQVGDRR